MLHPLTFAAKQLGLFTGALVVTALFSSIASASIVTSWDLDNGPMLPGDPGTQATEPAAFSATGIVGLAMSRGSGLTTAAAMDSFSSADWEGAPPTANATEYIELGFTVLPGFEVDLANLILATRSSGSGPGKMGVYTSIDAFASPLITFIQPNAAFLHSNVSLTSLSTLTAGTFRLRLIEVDNTQADTVGITDSGGTFRVAEYNTGGVGPLDVQFNGTIRAVPELRALSVWIGLCASVFAGWRRFRMWI